MTKHQNESPATIVFMRIGLILVMIPILALSLYGQAFYGSILGTITDQSGGTLRGSLVTLTNSATGER